MVASAARSIEPKTAPTEAPTTTASFLGHEVVVFNEEEFPVAALNEEELPVAIAGAIEEVDCVVGNTACRTRLRLG
jgi:hypothetical protein